MNQTSRPRATFGTLLISLTLLSACASNGGPPIGDGRASRAESCRAGDSIVSSEASCLQDDAACYQIANGDWCTGTREASCPTGSAALPTGAACPSGARCFAISESLECLVEY